MAFNYQNIESISKSIITKFGGPFNFWSQVEDNSQDFEKHIIIAVQTEVEYNYMQTQEYKPDDRAYIVAGSDFLRTGKEPKIGDAINKSDSPHIGSIKRIDAVNPDGRTNIIYTIYTGS